MVILAVVGKSSAKANDGAETYVPTTPRTRSDENSICFRRILRSANVLVSRLNMQEFTLAPSLFYEGSGENEEDNDRRAEYRDNFEFIHQ